MKIRFDSLSARVAFVVPLGILAFLVLALVSAECLVPSVTLAQEVAAQAQPQAAVPSIGRIFPLFFMVFGIFYFLVLRPQNQRLKEQESLLGSLKRGDEVVTTAGILGKVAGIEEKYILLDVGGNTKMKFEKAHVVGRPEGSLVTENKKGN